MQIGLLGAFIGGVLTLLSPCSVMLLPAFFSYAFADPAKLMRRTGVFYLGLITTLVPLGVLAGTLGAFVGAHRFTVIRIAAVVVILLGALMLLGIPIPGLRSRSGAAEGTSSLSVYALGTVYGLAGVCAGPLLGAVLTVATISGNALYGGVILLAFAAGMTVPLLLLALAWSRMPFVRRLVRPREVRIGPWRSTWTGVVGGILTIGLGVLILVTDGTSALSGLLGASDQVALESRAQSAAAGVPDPLVVGVVVAVAAAAWLLTRRSQLRRNSGADAETGLEPAERPDSPEK